MPNGDFMKPFLPLEVPEDLLDVVGNLIAYEEEEQDIEYIEEELERAYAELEIEYTKPKEEREYKIEISL